ncbi:hypothetical protein A7D25_23320 [Pseudomonas sp. 21C1]|nr:hypothetical protein A7D25_23320 [Pseudomonas sp. 21C1]
MGELITVSLTTAAGYAQIQGETVAATAQPEANTDAGTTALAVGVLLAGGEVLDALLLGARRDGNAQTGHCDLPDCSV